MNENQLKESIQLGIKKNYEDSLVFKPIFFKLTEKDQQEKLETLFESHMIDRVIDTYNDQLKELSAVRNPKIITQAISRDANTIEMNETIPEKGIWVYYSWKRTLVHILDEKDYTDLRLSRNKGLILDEEQEKYANFKVALAGLNVGNPGAVSIALEGGGHYMKFTDFDVLSVSNLNRFRAGITELDLNKAILSARQVYEINPFADVELYEKGLTDENIEEFLIHPKVDLLIEEMDSLKLKIKIREVAKKNGIPVLMVTGNGDGLIIDIERYDLDRNLPLLNGHMDKKVEEDIMNINPQEFTFRQKVDLSRDFMDAKYLTERLVKSFEDVGETMAGIPQISTASFLRGATLSYFTRQIAIGTDIPSGRYFIKLDDIIQK